MKKEKGAQPCDMRGFLSFLILLLLSKKPRNGKQISEEIEKRKGCKPSPGTIYPALKCLKGYGLIKQKKSGKEITYTLSDDGKKALKAAKEQFCRTFSELF